ncbi:hypothetical protein BJF85_12835 [Saccharomonospora sp. CUA-673]|uniref:hypothetical protein n=1 Tax=Saccharomonospora sp. CUA-673 TaxID=1904969 RepID=UPI000969DED3|nr:hypothetical protein [Saccharomonospora sp. CUA-673]OLT48398.1 hypothetical protein BJF85_12835 [Saccharomonospora sp. CUA-673]
MTKGAQVGARRFAAVGLVSGVVGVVLLAGCGQEPAPRPADQPGDGERTTTPSDDNEAADEQARVAWVDGYCRAAAEVVHSASRMPDIDTSTPERTTATSGELLTVMIGGLDSALEGLDELGAADARRGRAAARIHHRQLHRGA